MFVALWAVLPPVIGGLAFFVLAFPLYWTLTPDTAFFQTVAGAFGAGLGAGIVVWAGLLLEHLGGG